MTITASELRRNIYRLLDEVVATGIALEIERKGQRLRIVPVEQPSKLDRIEGDPDALVGDPDDLVHLDWSDHWTPTL